MRTIQLGSGGPQVGAIGLGCMGLTHQYDMATPRDEHESISLIREAIERGATLLDTSDVYGPYTNEELIGKALGSGYRERAIVATKVGVVPGGKAATTAGSNAPGAVLDGSPEHVRRSVDGSLRRLGVEYIDLYQLHRVDPKVPIEETWGAFAEAVHAGKVRAIGLSEVSVDQIQRAETVHSVATVQNELSLWTRDSLDGVLPYCKANGIGFLPFAPLGRGFLTGRFASADDLPQEDFRRRLPRFQSEAIESNRAIVDRVRVVADRYGATPAQVALAWLLAQGDHVIPIPGTKSRKYLRENIAAEALVLNEVDLAELDDVPAPVGGRF